MNLEQHYENPNMSDEDWRNILKEVDDRELLAFYVNTGWDYVNRHALHCMQGEILERMAK